MKVNLNTKPSSPKLPKVAMLVYDGIGSFHLAGPLMIFSDNGLSSPPVHFLTCSINQQRVQATSGFDLGTTNGLEQFEDADAVIIPGWTGVDIPVPVCLKQALQRAHKQGAHILGSCLGAFVLAESGLLDGRWATTHWQRSALFAQRYPAIYCKPDILFVRDDRLWTSAGGAAAIDTCLHMLQELRGAKIATQMAQRLISGVPRHGDQAQYTQQPFIVKDGDARLQQLIDWMAANPHKIENLTSIASRVHMTERTLTRRFRQLTGMTITQWRRKQQIHHARQYLETTSSSIEAIAHQMGFGSVVSLRRLFVKEFGIAPSDYRKQLTHAMHTA